METFEQDSENAGATELTNIKNMAKLLIALQKEQKEAEENLDNIKSRVDSVQMYDLPMAMKAVGMKDFSLDTGEKITVKAEVKAAIPKGFINEAIEWLKENGAESLVKNQVTVSFKMRENESADKLMGILDEKGYCYENKSTVHPASLTSFVKELLEEGKNVPRDILGVFTFDKAQIKVK